MFTGRTDAEAEAPVLWLPHSKSWLIGKDSDAGRDWGQEEKGMTEDEMAGWHHWLEGRKSEWTPGVGDGQRGLACCSSWGRKESDMTEWLNWTELSSSADLSIFKNEKKLEISSCWSKDHHDCQLKTPNRKIHFFVQWPVDCFSSSGLFVFSPCVALS